MIAGTVTASVADGMVVVSVVEVVVLIVVVTVDVVSVSVHISVVGSVVSFVLVSSEESDEHPQRRKSSVRLNDKKFFIIVYSILLIRL